ncbi:hypothetical protein I4U23_011083 [Adineta vaga]|nr:hypothetical protein I4U23_011083 [Adineta vaga]
MKLTTISFLVLFVISLTGNVHSQTCHGTIQYGHCSSNNGCGCLHFSYADDVGICAVLGLNCTRLSPCQWPYDTCERADHVCVRHPQCNSSPLCYPLQMVDQQLCPTLSTSMPPPPPTTTTTLPTSNYITSYYSNVLTNYSQTFPYISKYYHTIQILVNTSGYYNFTSLSHLSTFAYLYRNYFNPNNASLNFLAQADFNYQTNQFELKAFLQTGISYILIFTTNTGITTGSFTIVAYGSDYIHFFSMNRWNYTTPQNSVIANYSSALTVNSGKFSRVGNYGFTSDYNFSSNYSSTSNYYYETIEINVYISGYYRLTSLSDFDSYGYLYKWSFDPLNPSRNLLAQDDDGGNNRQFAISMFLEGGVSYILVFTTYSEGQLGSYKVIASGPSYVRFIRMNTNYSTITTSTVIKPDIIITTYSNALTQNSTTYPGTYKYYQEIQISVLTSGYYNLSSLSNIDSVGCLYRNPFIPSNLTLNQLVCNDDYNGSQFQITKFLQVGVLYTLVFTTFHENSTGFFSVVASGPNYIQFVSLYPLQTTTMIPTNMGSMYSSALTRDSAKYSRFRGNVFTADYSVTSNYGSSSNFYYEAIRLNITKTGTHTIMSQSSIDTYGFIYQTYFDPIHPSINILAEDDESGGNNQFKITKTLRAGYSYILVVTTWVGGVTGPFSIVVNTQNPIGFNRLDYTDTG